eukprot:TRINITY_DN585_c0_g3_i1.p1 TRINITY_DN585_c0_g3~~TRINITY_DN585_c0_g3_i1.p1  ORF type:complete len:534 (+),score=94.99 TRINITY_DN585_c0_g3_i1:118-1719(+)
MDQGDAELGDCRRRPHGVELQAAGGPGTTNPSLASRLSFRKNQRKGEYGDPNYDGQKSPFGGKGYCGDTSEELMNAKDTHDQRMVKVHLRHQFCRNGRLNPLERIQQMISAFLHPDEEAMQMEEETTRQKLMSPSVRELDVFDRLKAVYKVPPGNKTYDTTTPYALLLKAEGNVLKLVVRRIDFWVLICVHIFLNAMYLKAGGTNKPVDLGPNQGPSQNTNWPRVSTSMLGIPGMLLSFLLVFYNSQSFSRFMQQYWHTQRQLGAIAELVLLLRTYVPDTLFPEAKALRDEIWRLIHATHLLGFTGLPQQRAQDIDRWAWLFAHEKNLLTAAQIARLKPLLSVGAGNQPFKETMTWILQRVWELQRGKYISSQAAALFSEALWRLRGNIDVLYGFSFQPIPFAYFHLANSILIGYLAVLSYAFVFISPYYSVLGYILILFTFLGLRELSSVLADPFGNDDTDLPIFDYVNNMLKNMTALIDLPVTADVDHKPLPPLKRDAYTEDKSARYLNEESAISQKQNRSSQLDLGKNLI